MTHSAARWIWTIGLAVASLAAVWAAEVHGRASRRPFPVDATGGDGPVATAASAADALMIWSGAGVHGGRMLVLSGQWSRPTRNPAHVPTPGRFASAAPVELDPRDARSALFLAARDGIARRLDVVMPPAAFTHRIGEVAGERQLVREDGAFRLPLNGIERRFSTPRGFIPFAEEALVLIEPTWFAGGAPADPLGWLRANGIRWQLALVALDDPAADDAHRRAARAYAAEIGLEVAP